MPGWFFERTGADLKAAFKAAVRRREQEQVGGLCCKSLFQHDVWGYVGALAECKAAVGKREQEQAAVAIATDPQVVQRVDIWTEAI